MAFPFSPEEVRRHLKDLGYKDVNDRQLEEFVRDLRRLIRYEEKQKRFHEQLDAVDKAQLEQHLRRRRRVSSSTATSSAYSSSSSLKDDDEFPPGHGSGSETAVKRRVLHYRGGTGTAVNEVTTDSSSAAASSEEIVVVRVKENRRRSRSVGSSPKKPTTSFIRPPIKGHTAKKDLHCDPVRLYEYYRRCWEKVKFPGDDSGKQVRWAVREWMMGSKK